MEYSNEPVEEVLICREISSSDRLLVHSSEQSCSIGYRPPLYVRVADGGSICSMQGWPLCECVVLTGYEKSLKGLPLLPTRCHPAGRV